MSVMAEGIWGCTVSSANAGEIDGVMKVQVNVRIDDGPSAGRQTTYEDEVNARSALYIGRSCVNVGWKGADLNTLKADVDAWIKATGGKSSVEIKHITLKRGKKFDEWVTKHAEWRAAGSSGDEPKPPVWDKANSIGRGPKPLTAPSAAALTDANDAMRRAMAEDRATGGAAAGPAGNDDDLPFATCSTIGTGEIARVLRGAL